MARFKGRVQLIFANKTAQVHLYKFAFVIYLCSWSRRLLACTLGSINTWLDRSSRRRFARNLLYLPRKRHLVLRSRSRRCSTRCPYRSMRYCSPHLVIITVEFYNVFKCYVKIHFKKLLVVYIFSGKYYVICDKPWSSSSVPPLRMQMGLGPIQRPCRQ